MSNQPTPEPKRSLRQRLSRFFLHPAVHVASLVGLHVTALTVIAGLEKVVPFIH